MSVARGNFCGYCGKSEQNLVKDGKKDALKACTRCRSIRYCHRNCQRGDFEKHKKACDFIYASQNQLAKIEKSYEHFDLGRGSRSNLYKEHLGEFWELENANRQKLWETPPEGEPVWPQDYLKRKMKLVQNLWKMADTNQGNYETTEHILEHLIELLRLDASGEQNTRVYTAFMFLLLGRDQDAYDFIRFYLENPYQPPKDKYKRVQRGQWLTMDENQNKYEDLLSHQMYRQLVQDAHLGFKVALLALKIGSLNDLNENEAKVRKLEKKLSDAKEDSDLAKFNENPILMECLNLYFIGDLKAHEKSKQQQKDDIKAYLEMVHKENKTVLPAILDPQPLLKKDAPESITKGGPAEARDLVRFMHGYFKRLPTAKQTIAKFLYPNWEAGKPYPKYDTTFK